MMNEAHRLNLRVSRLGLNCSDSAEGFFFELHV